MEIIINMEYKSRIDKYPSYRENEAGCPLCGSFDYIIIEGPLCECRKCGTYFQLPAYSNEGQNYKYNIDFFSKNSHKSRKSTIGDDLREKSLWATHYLKSNDLHSYIKCQLEKIQLLKRIEYNFEAGEEYHNLGVILKKKGKTVFSKKFFRRAIEQFKRAISNEFYVKYHLLYKIITSCKELEDEEELIRQYHFVIRYRGRKVAKKNIFGKILMIIAKYYSVREKFLEAYKFLEREAIFYYRKGEAKKLFRIFVYLGNHAFCTGQYKRALTFYKKSLEGIMDFRKDFEYGRDKSKTLAVVKIKLKYVFRLIGITLLNEGESYKSNSFFLKVKKINKFDKPHQITNEIERSMVFLFS